MTRTASFDIIGPDTPDSPVVLSVPHAGRDYPLALRAALRVPLAALLPLEDRHVDAVAMAAREHETLFIQRRARAWIDLNRDEAERDPRVENGGRSAMLLLQTAKSRSGLGLIPRRAGSEDLWTRRLDPEEVVARIGADHRPYHTALATTLAQARARFGTAVLLDIHSMPPIGDAETAPRLVFGDRFGRAAAARFVHRMEAVGRAFGRATAINAPYAGGHVLDRHGRPRRGIHAIQIEFDRALYLDPPLDAPGDGLAETSSMLRAMIDAVADEALAMGTPIAAE